MGVSHEHRRAGRSLAAPFSAQAVKLGVRSSSWSPFGQCTSRLDTLILGRAIALALLVATLGARSPR